MFVLVSSLCQECLLCFLAQSVLFSFCREVHTKSITNMLALVSLECSSSRGSASDRPMNPGKSEASSTVRREVSKDWEFLVQWRAVMHRNFLIKVRTYETDHRFCFAPHHVMCETRLMSRKGTRLFVCVSCMGDHESFGFRSVFRLRPTSYIEV